MNNHKTPQNPPTIYPEHCHALSPTISRWCPLRAIDIHSLRSVGLYVDGKEIYHHLNHPIKWARITGVIVAIDEYAERRVLTVDDSSGACIECVCACPTANEEKKEVAMPGHLNQFQVKVTTPANKLGNQINAQGKVEGKERGKGKEDNAGGKTDGKPDQPSTKSPQIPWEALDIGSVVKIKGQITEFRDTKQIDVIKVEVLRGTELEVKCWEEVTAFRRDVLSKPWAVTAEEEARCLKEHERRLRHMRKGKPRNKDKGRGSQRDVVNEKDGEQKGHRAKRKEIESDEERRRRHGIKKRKEREEGLDPKDRVNYPSMAMRRRVAGKYGALGI